MSHWARRVFRFPPDIDPDLCDRFRRSCVIRIAALVYQPDPAVSPEFATSHFQRRQIDGKLDRILMCRHDRLHLPQPRSIINHSHPVDHVVDEVLKAVFAGNVPPDVRRRAHEIQNSFSFKDATYLGPGARRASGQEYDEWIDEIFRSIIAGHWREEVLRNFMRRLEILIERGKSDALFALVVEEIRDGGEFVHYRLGQRISHCNRIHPDHWAKFGQQLRDGSERPFFQKLFDAGPDDPDIAVWQARYISSVYPYQGEIDSLVRQSIKNPNLAPLDAFWLSCITLKSEQADQPDRLILIAYPDYGTPVSPKAGRSAPHEWRMMMLLRIAYRQLDHQLGNLDKRINAHREDLIRTLGPGILAHELHTQLVNLHDINVGLAEEIERILQARPDDPGILSLGGRVIDAIQETTKVFQVVQGYNNMMRARLLESFMLGEVVDEALALTRGRVEGYAKTRVLVERSRAHAISVESDRALLLVVLVNVLVNGAQAIQEAREPPRDRTGQLIRAAEPAPMDGDKIMILVESEPEDDSVVLLLANTGPEVLPEHRERIFTRGFTTRKTGHGQGLYLCRQLMEYLGGSIVYSDPVARNINARAGFRLEFSRRREPN